MEPHKGIKIGTPYKRRGALWSLGYHTGDDWLTPVGTKAYAMADGTVVSTSYNNSYGNNVIVESLDKSGRRVRWSVNHLSKIQVRTGQAVKAGQVVGLTGATGHVTGPHDHVEARIAPFTFSGAAFVDPQVMYDWQPKRVRPAWATLRPAKAPAKAYRAVSLNIGGMNDQGRATLHTRAPKIVKAIARRRPEVVAIQELPDGFVAEFDHLMVAAGFRRVVGQDGRYIYRAKAIERVAFGIFDLQPRYQGDDKQAAWAILRINGHLEMVVCGHLESDAPANDQRVGQALSMIDQAKSVATAHDLAYRRITFLADTNSDDWVRVQAFNERRWVDSAETAWRRSYATTGTFTGWVKRLVKPGPRIDGIYVYRSRPVVNYTTSTRDLGISDHLMIVADIGV